jgi:uncharacterized protein (TIGR03000 family)
VYRGLATWKRTAGRPRQVLSLAATDRRGDQQLTRYPRATFRALRHVWRVKNNRLLEVKMSVYSLATSRLAALAVAALLLTGKPATADESQPGARAPGRAVHFAVMVPADAEVWFDGAKTTQTGPDREFVSPPLQRGHSYSYDVRARWKDGGRAVDRTRHVTFYAGDELTLDFTPERVQEQYSGYDPGSADSGEVALIHRSWHYAPSSTLVPLSAGADRRRFRGSLR